MGIVVVPSFGSDPVTVTGPTLDSKVDGLATEFNGSIDNDNIKAAAAIAYSKLNLTGLVRNADIKSDAAIVDTKLATIATAGKVSGAALTLLPNIPSGAGLIPAANLTPAASQAEMEAGTEAAKYVAPSTVKYAPGVAKGWAIFDGTAASPITAAASHNVSGIVKNASGDYTVSWDTDFSSANYVCVIQVSSLAASGNTGYNSAVYQKLAGSISFKTMQTDNHSVGDKDHISIVAFGDQ